MIKDTFERTEAEEHFASHLKASEISGDQNNNIFKGRVVIMWKRQEKAADGINRENEEREREVTGL